MNIHLNTRDAASYKSSHVRCIVMSHVARMNESCHIAASRVSRYIFNTYIQDIYLYTRDAALCKSSEVKSIVMSQVAPMN